MNELTYLLMGKPHHAPYNAKQVSPLSERSAKKVHEEQLKTRKEYSDEKNARVLAALKIRGKISGSDFGSLGLDGMSIHAVEAALHRLRHKGIVRLVMAKPYWEVVSGKDI